MDTESSTRPPPGQATSKRRRAGGLVLIVAVVAGAAWLATQRPIECELSLTFGKRASEVRALRVSLREQDERARDAEGRLLRTISLQLPSGASAPITKSVRLRPGSYRAELVITDAAGHERTLRRTLTVERDACNLPIDVAD